MTGSERGTGEYEYEVSVVILTYHPDWNKLRQTVLSAVFQKDVHREIVIADDGSKDNCRKQLEELFEELQFPDYRLVMNPENRGTIANYISGLEASRGEYAKSISPGDFLTGETVLRDWLRFIRKEGCDWSFSEALYYREEDDEMHLMPTPGFPVYRGPYRRRDIQRCRWNYAVLDDAALGATMLGKTALKIRYAQELAGIGNKYCEDYVFRMMMFDGVWGGYYESDTVFYERGTGISSGGDPVWQQRIQEEFLRMSRLLMERKNPDDFQRRMLRQIRKKTSMKAMIRIPGKIRRALLFQVIRRRPLLDFEGTKSWREKCR